jgi:putative metalloprotease
LAGDMAADVAANNVSLKIADWMDNNNTVADESSEYYKRLSKLVSPNYIAVDGATLNYKVYMNPEANIIGTTDGSIRVYSGLMDILTDDELLSVISVQIGHIANKDARDALLKVSSGDNATKASAAQLEKVLSFSGEKLGTIVNELMQVPYSNKENEAADKFACEFLKKNGASAQGLKSALNKFAEMEANDKKAESDESLEKSLASKYISVNANNANRAALLP